jgi:hypothetical protein
MSEKPKIVVEYSNFVSGWRFKKRLRKGDVNPTQRIPDRYVFSVLRGMDIVKKYYPRYRKSESETISKSKLKNLIHISKKTGKFSVYVFNPDEAKVEESGTKTVV